MLHTYAQAVAAVRSSLQVGYLVTEEGSHSLGSLDNPSQGDLLLGVLGKYSLFAEEEEVGSSWVGLGVGALLSHSEEQGNYQPWVIKWHTHPESGLQATFSHEEISLSYEEGQVMSAELASLLNSSLWRVLA